MDVNLPILLAPNQKNLNDMYVFRYVSDSAVLDCARNVSFLRSEFFLGCLGLRRGKAL